LSRRLLRASMSSWFLEKLRFESKLPMSTLIKILTEAVMSMVIIVADIKQGIRVNIPYGSKRRRERI
jgi:hypothetical protein